MAKPRAASVNCPTCGKTISRKNDLSRHMKIHMPNKEARKLPCPYQGCPFRTLQKSNLKTHLNVHTGERPHKCPIQGCQFRTGDPSSLSRHRKEMHESPSRQRSRSDRPARTRKTTRRRRRMSPYPCSSLLLNDDYMVEGSKNTSPAYGTELTIKHVQVNDTPLALPENVYPVPSGSRVSIASEAPVADHTQLLVPDQGNLSTFGLDLVAPRVSHIAVGDGSFDGFCSGFNDWLPGPTPVYPGPSFSTPADRYTDDDTSLLTLASLSPGSYNIDTPMPASLPATLPLPVVSYTDNDSSTHILPPLFPGAHEATYAVDNSPAPLPGSWTLPAYEIQSTVNNASLAHEYDGYATEVPFVDQTDLWQPNSFATTDMAVGTYLQPQAADFDQGYLHATSIR